MAEKKTRQLEFQFGNYTSQYFANIYLNELDQYITRKLKNNTLIRYMDDFILLCKTKNDCIILKAEISKFINKELHLELNEKSKYYPYKMGVNFCGYRIFLSHKLLRLDSKKKIKKNIKNWNKKYHNGKLNFNHALQSISSWIGHASHCDSYKLQKHILEKCDFIYSDKILSYTQKNIIKDIETYSNKS